MLIIFHYCVILIFQILKNRKRLKSPENVHADPTVYQTDQENNLKFDPPVFKQRYSRVYETLLNEKWRNKFEKLVDFGCAEFGLFIFIKNLNVKQILFVDVDETLLKEKIGRIEPLLVDQLRRRNTPLEVSVFAGSVSDPDYRLQKTDVVTAIELIEHLYPDTLDAFSYNIFSFIEPKMVMVTTPNADFNIMFRQEGFRHPDHKFEWTREQFGEWALNIVKRFPNYTVEISGIGKGPEETDKLGCCSQMALFLRKDLLQDKYISPLYAKTCLCDKNSLCKGNTTECKLQCSCICPLCLPDFSVGVCTYFSCSKSDNHDVQIVQKEKTPKKFYSDTNLEHRFQPDYYSFSDDRFSENASYINTSHNIYYKLLEKIDYPFEYDTRSEEERLLQTFQYRIQVFSQLHSRFYISDKEHCEIPVRDIMYGDIDVSKEEVSHLLTKSGYQIEACTIKETGSCEDCIITVPQEMEDITSSSEVTDDFSSKSSEPKESTKFEANIESLSDWDEVTYCPVVMHQGAPSSSLDTSSEPKKPNPDPLFDSGYLKSPSPLETNSKLPQLPSQEDPELAETDQFEVVVSTPSMSSEDNKLHLKKTLAKEKMLTPLVVETVKQKYDPNRVNELDRFHNMSSAKTFMSTILKPQNEFKKSPFKEPPIAGPSSPWKKSRKFKDKKLTEKKEVIEPSPLDDAKSITNCIIQNSLNKIDIGEEPVRHEAELIRDLSPQQEINPNIMAIQEEQQVGRVAFQIIHEDFPALPQGVENGDLANNNRDNEGNNFVAIDAQEQDIDEGIDLLNDNLEELVPLLEDNLNAFDNNNDGNNLEPAPPREFQDVGVIEDIIAVNGDEHEVDESVARASREALFDVNSEQDLLEDFDIPPQADRDNIIDMLNLGNVCLVGVHSVSSSGSRRDHTAVPGSMSIQNNTNSFPNWLLHILGSYVLIPEEVPPVAPLGNHDEPHFYCQGDGLGVHPSVIAVDIDEAEDADNDASTEDSSSNNTVDFAEIEPGPSDMFDMSSLPEESSWTASLAEENEAPAPVGSSTEADQPQPIATVSRSHSSQRRVPSRDHIFRGSALVDEIIEKALHEVSSRSRTSINHCRAESVDSDTPNQSQLSVSFNMIVPYNSEAEIETPQSTGTFSTCDSSVTDEQDAPSAGKSRELGAEKPGDVPSEPPGNGLDDVSSQDSEDSEYFESSNGHL